MKVFYILVNHKYFFLLLIFFVLNIYCQECAVNVFFHYFLTVILLVRNFHLHSFHIYVCLPVFNSDPQTLFCLT
jgi:hypothetical protein